MAALKFPCTSCGAEVHYEPNTTVLKCPYCAAINQIPEATEHETEQLAEQDYSAMLRKLGAGQEEVEVIESVCKSCNAEVTLDKGVAVQNCPFCGSGLLAHNISKRLIKPRGVLPFAVTQNKAREMFRGWVTSRWFAPSALKQMAVIEGDSSFKGSNGLCGLYLPYWTYDCGAITTYTGQRGDDYYVTVPRVRTINGKTQTVMVQERRTRWSSVEGTVHNTFDDIVVAASTSLPGEALDGIGRFDLDKLEPFRDDYLSGFRAESYTLGLEGGFTGAQAIMKPTIEGTIRSDIGGDHQRIDWMKPEYNNITFKHILLPVWVSAYRYNGKVFRFLVNGRTGKTYGERPYSAWKITFVVILLLIAVLAVIAVASLTQR